MAYPTTTFIVVHNRSAETINGLNTTPEIRERFLNFIDDVYLNLGLLLLVYSGQRDYAEQWDLRIKYLQGGSRAASPGGSWHNFGRAIDVIPVDFSGRPIWQIEAQTWRSIDAIAAKYGLKSGASFGDPGHFKYQAGANLVQLRQMFPGWEQYAQMEKKVEGDNKWVKPLVITALAGLAGFTIFTYLKRN